MSIEFEDNRAKVKEAINDSIIAWLYEAGGELHAQTVRNSRTKTGETKGGWTYEVNESKGECVVGNPLENALWEEYGTGQYAVKKNGRSGYWVYTKDGSQKSKSPKSYTLAEAKKVVARMRQKGIDAYYTNGKKPNRTLERAFTMKKAGLMKSLGVLLSKGV